MSHPNIIPSFAECEKELATFGSIYLDGIRIDDMSEEEASGKYELTGEGLSLSFTDQNAAIAAFRAQVKSIHQALARV